MVLPARFRVGSSACGEVERIRPHLNEAGLRLWAANEALSLGYGGVSEVSRATELSRTTIHAGIAELENAAATHETNRIRRKRWWA